MRTIRHDERQPDPWVPAHYQARWLPPVCLTWNGAERLIADVCAALTEAAYRADDIARMRTSTEEAIFHLLERELLLGCAQPVRVSYRVNQFQAVVEIQTAAPQAGDRPTDPGPKGGAPYSFMTSIRYSRQDHAATVCDCQLIK